RALKLRQPEGTVKIALSFCTSSAYMGDLTSFLAVVVCVRSPFFRVKWLILPGQPVTPRKRYSIGRTAAARRIFMYTGTHEHENGPCSLSFEPDAGADRQAAQPLCRRGASGRRRSEEHTSELQSRENLVC